MNTNSTQFWLVGEGEDFQLALSSTATTTAIQDIILSHIDWNNQTV